MEEELNLIHRIMNEMFSDDGDDSDRLAALYVNANDQEKAILDNAFMCLCGWKLETLITPTEVTDLQAEINTAWGMPDNFQYKNERDSMRVR